MESDADPLIGRTIAGKFAVESLIGSGAMGAVYKARQVALDKVVAVKVLHGEHGKDPAFTARFQREARAASRLDHPNSMRVIDFGEEPDGLLYIAMEYLDGLDLFHMIQLEWPFSDERTVDILSQALAALAVAHDMGVVHRDLKPENIMILRGVDDEGEACDVVKVCDFGIAKIIEPETKAPRSSQPQRALTTQGIVVGTPEYMSPEQGKGELLDARSDLYSIGVILYQLLAGRVPFEAETAIGVVLKHVTEDPPLPSSLNARASKALEAVCLKAMSKRREHRPPSAREMRVELRAAVGLAPARVPSTPRAHRLSFASAETEQLPASDVVAAVAAVTGSSGVVGGAPAVRPAQTGIVRERTASKATPAGTAAVAAQVAPPARARRAGVIAVAAAALVIGVGATVAVVRVRADRAATSAPPSTERTTNAVAPTTPPTDVTAAPPPDEAPPSPTASPAPHATDKRSPLSLVTHVGPAASASAAADTSMAPPPPPPDTAPPPPPPPPPPVATDTTTEALPPPAPPPPPPFDPTRGRVSWGVASASGGATSGNVRTAVSRVAGGWNACYQSGLRRRGARDEGTITLSLTTDDAGRVTGASATGFDLPDVLACIRASVSGITIPNVDTGEGAATVTITLRVPE